MTLRQERERGRRQMAHKIPQVLCDRFGDKRTRDLKTFEKEFRSMCELYGVPEGQMLQRLVLHLEPCLQYPLT